MKARLNVQEQKHLHKYVEEKIRDFKSMYTENSMLTFRMLRTTTHIATTVAKSTPPPPRILWKVIGDSMMYEGRPFKFDDLRDMVHRNQDELLRLFDELRLGQLDVFCAHPAVQDNAQMSEAGLSFLDIGGNRDWLETYSNALLTRILQVPDLLDRFCYLDDGGRSVWSRDAMLRWLKTYADFHLETLVALELNTGGPARGTELTSMLIRNITTAQRNLYVTGGVLVFNRRYHKMRQLTGLDKSIPDPPDALTACLVLQDIILLRPLAVFFARQVWGTDPEVYDLYFNHAFVNVGRRHTTSNITARLKALSSQAAGVELGVNDVRHLLIAFKRFKVPFLTKITKSQLENPNATLAGHGRAVDQDYGASENFMSGTEEDIVYAFLNLSADWQRHLHIIPGGLHVFREEGALADLDACHRRHFEPSWEPAQLPASMTLSVEDVDFVANRVAGVLKGDVGGGRTTEVASDVLVDAIADRVIEKIRPMLVTSQAIAPPPAPAPPPFDMVEFARMVADNLKASMPAPAEAPVIDNLQALAPLLIEAARPAITKVVEEECQIGAMKERLSA
jgi:hypothetical protein